MDFENEKEGNKMTYRNYCNSLEKQVYGYILYIGLSKDPQDIIKVEEEINRLKIEINFLNSLTESQLHEQRKTVTHTIESCMKYLNN